MFTVNQRDPTLTLTLRRAYVTDYERRWAQVEAEALAALEQSGGIGPGRYFETEADFAAFLQLLMLQYVTANGTWQRPYLRAGYLRGLRFAHTDLRRSGIRNLPDAEAVLTSFAHVGALSLLFSQADNDLTVIQGAVNTEVLERLFVARVSGASVDDMLGIVQDRTRKIGRTRAETLARTIIVGAVAAATLNRLQDMGVRLVSAVVEMQFSTAGDNRVCPTCEGLATQDLGNGPGIYTIEQARGLIPAHARCRCRWQLVTLGRQTPIRIPRVFGDIAL